MGYTEPPWGCPVCHSALIRESSGSASLRCIDSGHSFPIEDELPLLIPEDQRVSVLADALDFANTWRAMGWLPAVPGDLLALPSPPRGSRHRMEWRLKEASLARLLALLMEQGARDIADMGAGVGWLSRHVAQAGMRAYAVEPSDDPAVGLGAARILLRAGPRFGIARGVMTHPPFRRRSLDAIVCNASIHYAADAMAVARASAECLRPGGIFYVMNTPVHHDKASASRAERSFRRRLRNAGARGGWVDRYHHLTQGEWDDRLRETFASVRRFEVDGGFRFRVSRALKSIALGMELASFPVYACEVAR